PEEEEGKGNQPEGRGEAETALRQPDAEEAVVELRARQKAQGGIGAGACALDRPDARARNAVSPRLRFGLVGGRDGRKVRVSTGSTPWDAVYSPGWPPCWWPGSLCSPQGAGNRRRRLAGPPRARPGAGRRAGERPRPLYPGAAWPMIRPPCSSTPLP